MVAGHVVHEENLLFSTQATGNWHSIQLMRRDEGFLSVALHVLQANNASVLLKSTSRLHAGQREMSWTH